MARHNRQIRGGFTLLEILLAIAIFALGGVAILALFIAQANKAKLAADANRAIDIAGTVRATIEAAVRANPRTIGTGENIRYLYPISFPFASLANESPRYGDNKQADGETTIDAQGWDSDPVLTYYIELPKEPFRGESQPVRGKNVTFFPADLRNISGAVVSSPRIGSAPERTGEELRVFYWKPDVLSVSGSRQIGDRLDNDDSDIYSFNFRIDRSVARTDLPDPADASVKQPVPGLYVVRLRIFRAYDITSNTNVPIHEMQFTIAATE